MKKSILFYGLLPSWDKIKTRIEIFSGFDRQYYFPNYFPDFRNNTLYIYTEKDEDFIRSKIIARETYAGNPFLKNEDIKFFDYFELVEVFQQIFPISYKYLRNYGDRDEILMQIDTCQISLNEILFWYHYLKSLDYSYNSYNFLSNSYDIKREHLYLFENTNWYTGRGGERKIKFGVSYVDAKSGVLSIDDKYAKKFKSIIIDETEKFYSNITYYDQDGERLKYHLIKTLGIKCFLYSKRLNLHKKHMPGQKSKEYKKNYFLYNIVYGCEERLKELLV